MKDQKELGQGDFSKIPNGAPGLEAYRAMRERLLGDLSPVVISS